MNSIKKISNEQIEEMVGLVANAYTEFEYHMPQKRQLLTERLQKINDEDETVHFWGCFQEEKMVGCMRFHDYTINLHKKKLMAGGVGLVAVDLLHKKEKVAKEMLTYFLEHYRDKGASVAMLYPFRPDFYKRMGFGFGTNMNLYKIKPEYFPKGPSKQHIHFLTSGDSDKLVDCYNQYALLTNGLLEKTKFEVESLFRIPENRIIGCTINGELQGYCVFTFKSAKKDNFLLNDLMVKELVYLNQEALSEIFTFFHSQADQVNRIVINTQEEDFYFQFSDPRNGSDNVIPFLYHETHTSGVGVMYRILDVDRFLGELVGVQFDRESVTIKWNVEDNFLSNNHKSFYTKFTGGVLVATEASECDVEVSMGIAEFSSLMVGAANFHSLVKYGLAKVSTDQFDNKINRLFAGKKPICFSGF
ncbi:GNAT family N-acetyltransferase [Pseudoneobacillus sp. C159]